MLNLKHHEAFPYIGHEPVVEGVHCIRRLMVVGIAVEGRVRDHRGLEALLSEGGVVAQAHGRHDLAVQEDGQLYYRQVRVFPEAAECQGNSNDLMDSDLHWFRG
jgi:hypothetical protein